MLFLPLGDSIGLSGQALFADGYHADLSASFSWDNSNPAVVSMDVSTRYRHATALLTGLQLGTSTITCTSGPHSTTIDVNVIAPPTPNSVTITPGTVYSRKRNS